jgi:hypothetical protein
MPNKTRKATRLPKYAGTMKGVQEWYVAEFEKLGWMVLAKAKGYNEKIRAYKKAIDHLLKTIEHIKAEYESANRKHDLNVVHMNTMVLKEFVAKNF